MAANLKKYRVSVPAEYIGHAIGHLSSIGGWLDHLDEAGQTHQVVSVRLPSHIDPATVKDVLAKIVQGDVTIVDDEVANDEDA